MMISLSDWLVSLAESYTDEYYAYSFRLSSVWYNMRVRRVTSYKDPDARTVVVIWRPSYNCGMDSVGVPLLSMDEFGTSPRPGVFGGLAIYGMEGVRWCDLLIVDNISLGEAF